MTLKSIYQSRALNPEIAPDLKLKILDYMVKTRATEERMIKMSKSQDGYFWIGGPGEEGFNIPLGLLINWGEGLDHDWFHPHYRSSGVLIAHGWPMIDFIRQMGTRATDPFSKGRLFSNHIAVKKLNLAPASSPIQVQFAVAIGTATAQMRKKAQGISIVIGGDAGTAEGEFHSSLLWSSRNGAELPMLLIITNNRYGISTHYDEQHPAEKPIIARAEAFGIKSKIIDGIDPENAWFEIKTAMEYVRTERKPYLLEVNVSRLYGHSSSTGCNFIQEEVDCIEIYARKLIEAGLLTQEKFEDLKNHYLQEGHEALEKVRSEPFPAPESIYDDIFCEE